MQQYILRRLLLMIPTFIGVTALLFLLLRVLPGDIVALKMENAPLPSSGKLEDVRAQLEAELGLDDPIVVQYIKWLSKAIRGDFGRSFWSNDPIGPELARALPTSIELGILGIGIGVMISLPIGVLAAVKQDSPLDYVLRVVAVIGLAVPTFWAATLFLIVWPRYFGWVQPIEYESLWVDPVANLKQVLPAAIILGFALAAGTARMLRSQVLEVLRLDYVRTARAKGLIERVVIYRHVLKNAMLPVVTIIGVQAVLLISGSVIIERIFKLPGVGEVIVSAISQRDYPMIQAGVVLVSLGVVFINLVVDLTYAWLDPRVKYS